MSLRAACLIARASFQPWAPVATVVRGLTTAVSHPEAETSPREDLPARAVQGFRQAAVTLLAAIPGPNPDAQRGLRRAAS